MRTRKEATAWLKNSIGKYIDYDKAYGVQCYDLVNAFYTYVNNNNVSLNGAYAKDIMKDNPKPQPGWKYIVFDGTPKTYPQPLDILIMGPVVGNTMGHTSVCYEAGNAIGFKSLDENYNSPGEKVTLCSHTYKDVNLKAMLRPTFPDDKPATVTKPSVAVKKAPAKADILNVPLFGYFTDKYGYKRTQVATKFICKERSGIITKIGSPLLKRTNGPDMEYNESVKFERVYDSDGLIWVYGYFKGKATFIPVGNSDGKGQIKGKAWGTFE